MTSASSIRSNSSLSEPETCPLWVVFESALESLVTFTVVDPGSLGCERAPPAHIINDRQNTHGVTRFIHHRTALMPRVFFA